MADRPSVAAVTAALRGASHTELPALIASCADDPRAGVVKARAAARRRYDREAAERRRVLAMYERARELGGGGLVVGVDEVGRGPLAGPLTVCATALDLEDPIWGIDDSKRLSPTRRESLAEEVRSRAVAVGLACVDARSIDRLGMAEALRRAMRTAVARTGLWDDASAVVIDGLPVHVHPREACLPKADAAVAPVAAASIVAKVFRDGVMETLDARFPGYGFAANKGYGSAEHIAAIGRLGLSPIHRVSFCGHFVTPAAERVDASTR
ncbi:ribonuclease HII [Olsenella sp. YH-ols2217]|uniref:Ribonuclease HII n=1 Tax=Kribbibacterium absianum TaxID=3044210 RepID=A0ABT6ZIY9_9ACTN|nr:MULTISPECIES: ribonuclease HII [unclassified Olsenella]MDJ1121526.1 ribonuclease HII [Olsenella sp. YH-ols2216]MDJ1129016.1 ribonuclease HII [Olsenella sp. YH-ols2217]